MHTAVLNQRLHLIVNPFQLVIMHLVGSIELINDQLRIALDNHWCARGVVFLDVSQPFNQSIILSLLMDVKLSELNHLPGCWSCMEAEQGRNGPLCLPPSLHNHNLLF